jgi:hypothetical protein
VVISRRWSPQAGVLTEARSVGCVSFRFNDQRLYVRAFVPSVRMRICVAYMLCNREFYRNYHYGLWLSKDNPLSMKLVHREEYFLQVNYVPYCIQWNMALSTCDQLTSRKISSDFVKHFRIIYHNILTNQIRKYRTGHLTNFMKQQLFLGS